MQTPLTLFVIEEKETDASEVVQESRSSCSRVDHNDEHQLAAER
jgi:hypothetical protein